MSNVLNPWLHQRLQDIFGQVMVASRGLGVYGAWQPAILSPTLSRFQMVIAGEYYRVNCPFCVKRCGRHDTRQRLWIHHLFGHGRQDHVQNSTDDKFYWAAHCFNEECTTVPAYRKELRNMIFNAIGRNERKRITVAPGIIDDGRLYKTDYPGTCIALDALSPDHHANVFLRSKGYDPVDLAQHYKVRWCQQAPIEYAPAHNRIIFPVYMRGEMVGWQGRYIGDIDWKRARVPKYYTMPGSHTRNMLYGFDDAVGMPFVIVTEGVTDVISVGAGAVATFGKKQTLSMVHFNLLVENWPIIILLMDGDAYRASEMLYQQMRRVKPVVWVQLPDGVDPADAVRQDRAGLWRLILWSSKNQGVQL